MIKPTVYIPKIIVSVKTNGYLSHLFVLRKGSKFMQILYDNILGKFLCKDEGRHSYLFQASN